jgi:hypothetical protein
MFSCCFGPNRSSSGVPVSPAQEKQQKQGTHTIRKQYKVQNTTAAPKKEKSKQ